MIGLAGQTIGDYIIGEQIAESNNIALYMAHHPAIPHKVCIKVLSTQNLADEQRLIRFEREALTISRFDPKCCVVPMYDYWCEDDAAYLVLKYLGGGSLKDRLKLDGPLPLEGVVEIYERLTIALEAAHSQQIVHRDIKPSNVLFDEQGKAYLADFGIVKYKDSDLTVSREILGTPAYLAPEQIRTQPVSPQTDIYALGLMLYECVVGDRPFQASNAVEVMVKQIQLPMPTVSLPDTYQERMINEVIRSATQKAPGDRYPSVRDMMSVLRLVA